MSGTKPSSGNALIVWADGTLELRYVPEAIYIVEMPKGDGFASFKLNPIAVPMHDFEFRAFVEQ